MLLFLFVSTIAMADYKIQVDNPETSLSPDNEGIFETRSEADAWVEYHGWKKKGFTVSDPEPCLSEEEFIRTENAKIKADQEILVESKIRQVMEESKDEVKK